jgi:hypothetical protein
MEPIVWFLLVLKPFRTEGQFPPQFQNFGWNFPILILPCSQKWTWVWIVFKYQGSETVDYYPTIWVPNQHWLFLLGTNHSTLINSTLIILFSEMLKFSKIIRSKSKDIVKENNEYLGIFHLLKWIFQN